MRARRFLTATGGALLAAALVLGVTFTGDDHRSEAGGDVTIRLEGPLEQHDETQGVYRRQLLLVDDPNVARILLDGRVVANRLSVDALERILPDEARREDGRRVLVQISRTVSALWVVPGIDPLDLAIAVRQRSQFESSPIHVIGLAAHWKWSPGTDPTELANLELAGPIPVPEQDAPAVAVIDTGFRPGRHTRSAASSTLRGVIPLSSEENELPALDASLKGHGMFVASLIRQMDPRLRVVVGRLGALPAGVGLDGHDGGEIEAPMLSDELHLLASVIRMKRHVVTNDIPTAALNLSLGTPASTAGIPANGDVDGLAVAVRAAIDHWNSPSGWPRRQAPPVIAAAGNHDGEVALEPEAPFVPGAYSDVYAVVAVNAEGVPASFTYLGWPDDLTMLKAPGTDLVAVRRRPGTLPGEDQLWSWGGTSFATALVSARAASVSPPESVEMSAVGPPPGGPPPHVLVVVP